uniref:Uncharacterized protein n=1 Tax=Arundo donax TaxID=35708 RepID=A0A0A9C9E8_ARUDO
MKIAALLDLLLDTQVPNDYRITLSSKSC